MFLLGRDMGSGVEDSVIIEDLVIVGDQEIVGEPEIKDSFVR